jgi:hypothetical protein
MTKLVLDPSFAGQLAGFTAPVELCDPDGRPLGQFVPVATARFAAQSQDGCPYSTEELERMRQETGGRSLREIWSSLGRK